MRIQLLFACLLVAGSTICMQEQNRHARRVQERRERRAQKCKEFTGLLLASTGMTAFTVWVADCVNERAKYFVHRPHAMSTDVGYVGGAVYMTLLVMIETCKSGAELLRLLRS